MRMLSGVLTLASIAALVIDQPGWCIALAGVAFVVYQFLVPKP
jgi:hypothetical protein